MKRIALSIMLIMLIMAASLGLLSGCTAAPKETIELAEIVDQQIAAMQSSHEKFVALYYAKLRDDVDRFMEQRWTPTFLDNVIKGSGPESQRFNEMLDKGYKLTRLDWNRVSITGVDDPDAEQSVKDVIGTVAAQERTALGFVLLDFSTEVQRQVDIQRTKLITPIDQQEALVLEHLRDGYADLQRGSAAIKGYLASVVEISQQRDEMLSKLGALDAQKQVVATAVGAGESAMGALFGADDANDGIAGFIERITSTTDEIRNIFDSGE